jgi:hypothetical protein
MPKNKDKRNPQVRKAGRPKRDLEGQAQEMMQSNDLKELDQVDIPDELRDRLEGADVAELDDLEHELGFIAEEPLEKQAEIQEVEEMVPPQTQESLHSEIEAGKQWRERVAGSCEIKISDDRMSAQISLYPSQHGGNPLDFGTVKSELASAGVVFGINEELLKKLIITVEKTHEKKEGVIIAKGLPPEEGKDGAIEYHFGEDEAALGEAVQEQENT